jgi:hypothetical protein
MSEALSLTPELLRYLVEIGNDEAFQANANWSRRRPSGAICRRASAGVAGENNRRRSARIGSNASEFTGHSMGSSRAG